MVRRFCNLQLFQVLQHERKTENLLQITDLRRKTLQNAFYSLWRIKEVVVLRSRMFHLIFLNLFHQLSRWFFSVSLSSSLVFCFYCIASGRYSLSYSFLTLFSSSHDAMSHDERRCLSVLASLIFEIYLLFNICDS